VALIIAPHISVNEGQHTENMQKQETKEIKIKVEPHQITEVK
jgi:hypothetical protein